MGVAREPEVLFHYCCRHSARKIRTAGRLVPNPQPFLDMAALVWLCDATDLAPGALGLNPDEQVLIHCDRTEWRAAVGYDRQTCQRWTTWAHEHRVPLSTRLMLECGPDSFPAHWWVSEVELPVLSLAESL